MKSDIQVLDCNPNGIVATEPGTTNPIKFGKAKELCYFRNKELLDAALYRENIKEYDCYFYIENFGFVNYDKFRKVSYDLYQGIVGDTILEIVPTTREKMYLCGYFSFTDSPKEKILDYKEGKELNNVVFETVKESMAYLFRSGTFKSVSRDFSMYVGLNNITPLKYTVPGSTMNLRLMRGFELVKINEYRKKIGDKVLPFIGDNDKYKNIYFCFSRDENEFKGDKMYYDNANIIIGEAKSFLETNYSDLEPKIEMISSYPVRL